MQLTLLGWSAGLQGTGTTAKRKRQVPRNIEKIISVSSALNYERAEEPHSTARGLHFALHVLLCLSPCHAVWIAAAAEKICAAKSYLNFAVFGAGPPRSPHQSAINTQQMEEQSTRYRIRGGTQGQTQKCLCLARWSALPDRKSGLPPRPSARCCAPLAMCHPPFDRSCDGDSTAV